MAKHMKRVQAVLGLPRKAAISKNTSDEVQAFWDELEWPWVDCTGPTFNFVVKDALKETNINNLGSKSRNPVSYFNRNPSANGHLVKNPYDESEWKNIQSDTR